MTIEKNRSRENGPSAGEARLGHQKTPRDGDKIEQVSSGGPQTWSADHSGGVSPPTSTGSIHDEQVQEPANDWPAADKDPAVYPAPSPVEDFSTPDSDGRRRFQNGDTDRGETVGKVD